MALPPGFVLEEEPSKGVQLPPGFQLETEPAAAAPKPQGGFIPAVQRGFLQTGILMGDILPAMAGRLFGANEYAERQFREAAETEQKIQEKYAAAVPSYKDVKGVGDAITYITESVGELIPSILPSLFTGGIAGVASRGAVIAAKEAAEAAAKKKVAEQGAEALAKKEVQDEIRQAGIEAARRTAIKYDAVGIVAGSSLQNVPEVYKNIKDETEQESIGSALLFGGFNSLLDAALPLSILTKLRKSGIPEEQAVGAWIKRFGVGASKGFLTEGATEAAQEMSSAAAEKFVDENQEFFSEKNLERFLNAGLKGGLGGGVVSGTTDVVLGKKSLTPEMKSLDEDIRNTQSDIIARKAFLEELRAQADEEGRNRLDKDALKDLGFRKGDLYNILLNKDINDPAQAEEIKATLSAASTSPEVSRGQRQAATDALNVINEYLSTREVPDVGQVVETAGGEGVPVPVGPTDTGPAPGVEGVERTGVVPPVADVGAPVAGEGVPPAPVTPAEFKPPTTQELIAEQESVISSQMEKFQGLLQEQVKRYGLTNVGVKVIDDLKNANGVYSKGLIQLAVNTADPVRALKHESIHALKELEFFTPAQWQSLVKQANTTWIDTYLRNRDIDGNYLQPGKESRYDAYTRLFKQQGLDDAAIQESMVEEAIADAFGDFAVAKAPPGMIRALIAKMRNLFQSIKESVGMAEVTPERLFERVEKGQVSAPQKTVKQETPTQPKASLAQQGVPSPRGVIAEVAPNPDQPVSESWKQMTDEERMSATKSVANQVVGRVLDYLGFKGYKYQFSSGTYEGQRNPNVLISAPDSASAEDLSELASVLGYVLDQKAMVAFDEFNTTSDNQAGFVKVFLPKGMDDQKITQLRRHIADRVPQAEGDTLRDGALLYGNFSAYNDSIETLTDDQYRSAIVDAIESFDYDGSIDVSLPVRFHSELVWPDKREDYLEGTRYGESKYRDGAPGPDARREGRNRLQYLSEEALKLRDRWIDSRAITRSVSGGIAPQTGEPQAEYGSPREGAVSAIGVHFSQKPRDTLISGYYGTGLRGAEADRLSDAKNSDIKPRIYFYVNTGKGVRQEAGVGGVQHIVRLNNLYDVIADPLGIIKNNRGEDANDRASNLERSIMRAGFDGYLHRDPIGQQGFAVLIGRHNIPIEQKAPEGKFSLRGEVPLSTRAIMEANDEFARAELGLNIATKRGIANKVRDIGIALNEQTLREQGKMDRKKLNLLNETAIAKAIADEVAYQLTAGKRETGTGLGWYSNNYPRAVKRLGNRFPELATNRHARAVFTALVAVTSNGEKVNKNIDNAITLYSKLRSGKPLVAMGNRRATALENNLQVIQDLLAKHGTDFEKVLKQEITVKDMNAQLRAMGEEPDTSYLYNTVVPAAAVYFGPKLGAFYANLSGSEGYLTMDLWWTRSINRMRGLLIPRATDASIEKFRDMIGDPSMDRDDLVAATIPLRNKYEEFGYTTELEHLVGSKEPSKKGAKPAWFTKAQRVAGPAYDQLLYDHNLEKMANTIYKNEFEGLEEAPFTANDRDFMYRAARRAQGILRSEGIDLTLADIQAALWYYEKRLYEKLSGRKADDIGYEEAIIAQSQKTDRREGPSVVFPERDGRGDVARGEVAGATEVRGEPAQAEPTEVTPPKFSLAETRLTTPELQEAAKKSAIVDKDGNLIPMYHGTGLTFFKFRPKQAGATFVSPNPRFAQPFTSASRNWMVRHIGEFLPVSEIRPIVQELRQRVYAEYGKQSKTTMQFMDSINDTLMDAKETGVYKFKGELEDIWYDIAFSKIPEAKEQVMELYVLSERPFDYDNKEHVNTVMKNMLSDPEVKRKYGYEPAPKGVDIFAPENFMLKQTLERTPKEFQKAVNDRYKETVSLGDWSDIETPEVQRAIRKNFDSFYVSEGRTKNLGVYDITKIKSIDKNVGTFGQRPPTAEEAARVGMTEEQAVEAQKAGDIRFSLRSGRWTDKRIESLISSNMYTQNGREGDTKGYAAFIRPSDFLDATATRDYRERLETEREPLRREELANERQPITLDIRRISPDEYEITGHEGRHRMMALRDAGIEEVPVYLGLSGGSHEKSAKPKSVYLRPQSFGSQGKAIAGIRNVEMTPLSWEYRDEVKQKFGGEGEVKFSLRAPQTEAFRRWFGDSKVVDANGEPKLMYHGLAKDTTDFTRKTKRGAPIFLTDDPVFAEKFAKESQTYGFEPLTGPHIMPLFVKAENPFDYQNTRHIRRIKEELNLDDDYFWSDIRSGNWEIIELPEVQEAIQLAGFDSFYVKEEGRKNLAVYKPTQVKSAIGNVGTFEPTSPDIRFSLKSQIDPAITARTLQTTTVRQEKGFEQRITDAIAPESRSRYRAAALNRYNRLGDADKLKLARSGGAEMYADQTAESAALLSDLGAGIVAGALGVYDKIGGVPVYNRYYAVEKRVPGPQGDQFIQLGGKITDRRAAEAFAKKVGGSVKERGYVTVSNKNNTIKGPLAIFAPLAKYGDPMAYQYYQFWAGVKRGEKWMTNAQGQVVKERLFEKADIQKAEQLRQQFLKDGVDFEKIQKEWNAYNDALVEFMVDTGVLSRKQAYEFTKHGDYLPFYRQIQGDDDAVGPRIFQSIAAVKQPRKLKGGEDPLGDFLENMVRNTQAAVQAGVKNIAARRAADVGMDVRMVDKVPKGATPDPINSFYVLEDGEKVYYDTSDMLFIEAIKSLGMPDLPFIGLLAAPANVLRNLVTKDPGFMLANMMRDSLAAWTTSGVNMTPITATLANFTKTLAGQSPEFNILQMAGIIGGYDYSQGTKEAAKEFGKELRRAGGKPTAGEKAMRPFTYLWEGLEKGTQASDAATRIEVYKSTLKETGNEAEALFRALEVMNFNRKGNNPIVRVATAAIPFLNARMQGLDVLYRAGFGKNATKNAKEIQRAFWVRGMTIAALSTMYWMLTHDDEEYKRQEQETRDNNWLFPSLGIRIPIPFEVGVLFKVIPERIAALTLGDDTAKDFTKSMARNLASTLAVNPIPQTILPLVEATTNFSFFTFRPIVGQGLEGVAPGYQVGPGTSRLAEGLGGALNMSPMKIDQIIKGYTGTIGQYMSDVIDAVWDMHTDNPKASKRFEQMPVVKRFALDPDARGQVTAYYDLKNSVDEATRTANLLERSMNFEQYGQYMSENIKMFAFKDYILDLEKTMKQYRDTKNMVRSLPMDADAKRDLIRAITQIENQMTSNIQMLKKQTS